MLVQREALEGALFQETDSIQKWPWRGQLSHWNWDLANKRRTLYYLKEIILYDDIWTPTPFKTGAMICYACYYVLKTIPEFIRVSLATTSVTVNLNMYEKWACMCFAFVLGFVFTETHIGTIILIDFPC